jgi:hypothetical protein
LVFGLNPVVDAFGLEVCGFGLGLDLSDSEEDFSIMEKMPSNSFSVKFVEVVKNDVGWIKNALQKG